MGAGGIRWTLSGYGKGSGARVGSNTSIEEKVEVPVVFVESPRYVSVR